VSAKNPLAFAGSSGRTRAGGFTLLELMIAVAITAVLMTIVAPSFRTTVLNSRRAAVVNEVLGTLQLARSEAIKQNRATRVCPSVNQTSCSTTATDWGKGWLSFVEGTGSCSSTRPDTSCGDVVLRASANNYEGITISATTTNLRFLSFNGTISGSRTLTFCDSRGNSAGDARAIVLDPAGRARIGVIDGDGAALTCP